MREHRAREAQRLVEADGAHEEGERLGHRDRVERDAEVPAEREREEEADDGGQEDARGEPEVRPERTRGEEEPQEGRVHEDVA